MQDYQQEIKIWVKYSYKYCYHCTWHLQILSLLYLTSTNTVIIVPDIHKYCYHCTWHLQILLSLYLTSTNTVIIVPDIYKYCYHCTWQHIIRLQTKRQPQGSHHVNSKKTRQFNKVWSGFTNWMDCVPYMLQKMTSRCWNLKECKY